MTIRIKRWIIVGVIYLLVSVFCIPQAATDTHFFLLHDIDSLTLNPVIGWSMVMSNAQVRYLYFAYVALGGLFFLWTLISGNSIGIKSNMQRITPDIATPCAAGQGQFGTAKWMHPSNISKFFAVWKVPHRRKWFRTLLAAGKASYKEVKNADIRID